MAQGQLVEDHAEYCAPARLAPSSGGTEAEPVQTYYIFNYPFYSHPIGGMRDMEERFVGTESQLKQRLSRDYDKIRDDVHVLCLETETVEEWPSGTKRTLGY